MTEVISEAGFDIARLIKDAGGWAEVSAICGVSRPTPYNWARRGKIPTEALAAIKLRHPNIDLNAYVRLKNE